MYDVIVRTTLTIDDDVLLAAKQRAALEGISVGEALSAMARAGLANTQRRSRRNGVPLLPNASREVTAQTVRELLDEWP